MEWIAAAIVFVALLFLFPRQVGYVLSVATVVGIGIAAYFWLESQADDAAEARVLLTARLDEADSGRCIPDYPLSIGFVNNSTRAVKSIYFSVTVRRKGYSEEIGNLPSLMHTKILAPGETFGWCYAMPTLSIPTDPKVLEFDTLYKSVSWQ